MNSQPADNSAMPAEDPEVTRLTEDLKRRLVGNDKFGSDRIKAMAHPNSALIIVDNLVCTYQQSGQAPLPIARIRYNFGDYVFYNDEQAACYAHWLATALPPSPSAPGSVIDTDITSQQGGPEWTPPLSTAQMKRWIETGVTV